MKYYITVACTLLANLMLVSCHSSKESVEEYSIDKGEALTIFLPNGNWVVVDCRENVQSISISQFSGHEVDFSRSFFWTDLNVSTDSVIREETLHYSKKDGMPYMKIITDYETKKVRLWDINTNLIPKKNFDLNNAEPDAESL